MHFRGARIEKTDLDPICDSSLHQEFSAVQEIPSDLNVAQFEESSRVAFINRFALRLGNLQRIYYLNAPPDKG